MVDFMLKYRDFYAIASFFMLSLILGSLLGLYLFPFELKSLFFVVRQFYYLFILIPLVNYTRVKLGFPIVNSLVSGLIFSLVFNWTTVDVGGGFFSLPGQNSLGYVISVFLLLIYFELDSNIFKYILLSICLLSLFFTLSKSAIILGLVFVLIILYQYSINRFNYRNIVSVILILSIIFINYDDDLLNLGEYLSSVINTEISASEGSDSNSQRIALILNGLYSGLLYPIGIGAGHYVEAVNAASFRFPVLWIQPDPHNSYVHVAYASGVIGLLFYFFILFKGFFLVDKNWKVKVIYLFFLFNGLFHGEFLTQNLFYIILAYYLSRNTLNSFENTTCN